MDEMPWFFIAMFWSALALPVLLVILLFLLILGHAATVDPTYFRPGVGRGVLVAALLVTAACIPGLLFWVMTL